MNKIREEVLESIEIMIQCIYDSKECPARTRTGMINGFHRKFSDSEMNRVGVSEDLKVVVKMLCTELDRINKELAKDVERCFDPGPEKGE